MKGTVILLAVVALAGGVRAATVAVVPTNAPSDFAPQVRESTYAPEKNRDPFLREGQRVSNPSTTAAPVVVQAPRREIPSSLFRLQAILLDGGKPMAVINGELLEQNKPTKILIGGSALRVKAVQIGRERVVLDVEGQKVEVRLEEPTVPPKPK